MYLSIEDIRKFKEEIRDKFAPLHREVINAFVYGLSQLTPADVEPVKHGKWKVTNIPSYFGGMLYECSVCGAKDGDHSSVLGTYCWRCGAKMIKD